MEGEIEDQQRLESSSTGKSLSGSLRTKNWNIRSSGSNHFGLAMYNRS